MRNKIHRLIHRLLRINTNKTKGNICDFCENINRNEICSNCYLNSRYIFKKIPDPVEKVCK